MSEMHAKETAFLGAKKRGSPSQTSLGAMSRVGKKDTVVCAESTTKRRAAWSARMAFKLCQCGFQLRRTALNTTRAALDIFNLWREIFAARFHNSSAWLTH